DDDLAVGLHRDGGGPVVGAGVERLPPVTAKGRVEAAGGRGPVFEALQGRAPAWSRGAAGGPGRAGLGSQHRRFSVGNAGRERTGGRGSGIVPIRRSQSPAEAKVRFQPVPFFGGPDGENGQAPAGPAGGLVRYPCQNSFPSAMMTDAPPPTTVIEARRGWRLLDLGELWRYRELLLFLVWRDVKVRYKQTALGAVWAVL